MKNSKLISEAAKVSAQVITVTSAAGATSTPVDMQSYRRALLVAAVDATAAALANITFDLMESTAATAAGSSAAGSKVGIVVGSSVNTSIPVTRGVQSMLLTAGTGATGATGDAITIAIGSKSRTFAFSTSTALHNSSAWSTSKLYFGSTVGSTVDTGMQLAMGMLGSAVRSTLAFGPTLVVSTPATNTVQLTNNGDLHGSLGFGATGSTAFVTVQPLAGVGAFDIDASELSTGGKRYLSLKASTAVTSVKVGVCVIRTGARSAPAVFNGNLSTVNYAT